MIHASRNPPFRSAQPKGKRDQLLLRPVVEIALDAPSCFVGGCNHARARGSELLAYGGIGDRGCNELSKASEPFLPVRKESLVLRRGDVDGAPDGSIDNDRDADRGREARLTRHGVKSAGSSETVDAHGLAGAVDRGGETGNVERQAATGLERRGGRGRLR